MHEKDSYLVVMDSKLKTCNFWSLYRIIILVIKVEFLLRTPVLLSGNLGTRDSFSKYHVHDCALQTIVYTVSSFVC